MTDFFNITAAGKEAEVDIFGVIGELGGDEEGIASNTFIKALRGIGRVSVLNINIHTPGGSMWDALAMYQAIRDFPAKKVVHISALSASAGTVIMLAADTVLVSPEAHVMIHDPILASMSYSAADAAAVPVRWNRAKNAILDIYQRHTGADRELLSDMMAAETWFVGEEIVEAGFADAVKSDQPKMRVAAGPIEPNIFSQWKRAPATLLNRKPATLSPERAERLAKLRGEA